MREQRGLRRSERNDGCLRRGIERGQGGGRSELVSFPSILLLLYISKVEAKAERLTVCESNSKTFIPETSVNILSRKKLIALEVSISSFPSLAGGGRVLGSWSTFVFW